MSNSINEAMENLSVVQYGELLKYIRETIKESGDAFGCLDTAFTVRLDEIASKVVTKARANKKDGLRPYIHDEGISHCTINLGGKKAYDKFALEVERVKAQLEESIKSTYRQQGKTPSLENYFSSLVSSHEAFTDSTIQGLKYPFQQGKIVSKHTLHAQTRERPTGTKALFSTYKFTFTFSEMDKIKENLVDALVTVASERTSRESQLKRVRDALTQKVADEQGEPGVLLRAIFKEALGQIKREARIQFLQYQIKECEKDKKLSQHPGLGQLRILTDRLRKLQRWLQSDQSDQYFRIAYAGEQFHIVGDLFSRSDSLNSTPVFTEIDGLLSETFLPEKGIQAFTFGGKNKLNGRARGYAQVLTYYLSLLDPQNAEHKTYLNNTRLKVRKSFFAKVLRILILYFFLFKKHDDPHYDPAQDIEQEILQAFRTASDNENSTEIYKRRQDVLRKIKESLTHPTYTGMLNNVCTLLRDFSSNIPTATDLWDQKVYLSVKATILDLDDDDRMLMDKLFFQKELTARGGEKHALQYIAITDASTAEDTLCSLPVNIKIEPFFYYSNDIEQSEQIAMHYGHKLRDFLPIIYLPDTEIGTQAYHTFKGYKHIRLRYNPNPTLEETSDAFIYHFTFLLLNYLVLKIIADLIYPSLSRRIFFPLLRIHTKQKGASEEINTQEEDILRSITKVVSHIISEEEAFLANSQGLVFNETWKFKLPNALSSLYNALPRTFQLPHIPELEHMAIIIISSRKADARYATDQRSLACMYGEYIGLDLREREKRMVRLTPLGTFSTNIDSERMYENITVLKDLVEKCYSKGYKHILYIADAPFTSNLHLSKEEKESERFFMSKSIIQSLMEDHDDLFVYPVYYDKFFVMRDDTSKGKRIESFFIDDVRELAEISQDESQQSVMFFNILNGYAIPRGNQKLYSGVTSYSTLLSPQAGPLHDQYIRTNLLDPTQPGSLKHDIQTFIALLHYARYERQVNEPTNNNQQTNQKQKDGLNEIQFKLDPYENTIGSDSVGKLAEITNWNQSVRFNMLAFLTEVRGILNKRYSDYKQALDQANIEEIKEMKE